jgi:hypothetical protein
MKKLTYYQLKTKTKSFLWQYGVDGNYFSEYDLKMGEHYFDKKTILEILSVTHTEWKNLLSQVKVHIEESTANLFK